MTSLAASDLTVRRGGRSIVEQVSLTAQSGEFVAVVGANGAGKSTLLALLAGLLQPDDGGIAIDGAPMEQYSGTALARCRAYLPQNPRCEWPISVERLVGLGLTPTLRAFGTLSPRDEAKITRALEIGDLLEQRRQPATSLSGGELARAMLARAFIGEPAVLVVDEPIAGLDPRHALEAMQRLQSFAKAGGLVIAAIHDLTLAARYATRIVALRQGRVEMDGPVTRTLTAELLRKVFDVEARVVDDGARLYVDYIGPSS